MVTKEEILVIYKESLEKVVDKCDISSLRAITPDEEAAKNFWQYHDYDGSLEKIDLDSTMRSYILGLNWGRIFHSIKHLTS